MMMTGIGDVLAGRAQWAVETGDCLDVLRGLADCSIDAVVTDPPYGIGFMGREWDTFKPATVAARVERKKRKTTAIPLGHGATESAGYVEYDFSLSGGRRFQVWCEAWARECLRVLKPGGHLVSFGGCRTYHRLASGIEDAGFEVRDSLHWIFGSGFPKSLDVSKAIDRMAGAEREVVGPRVRVDGRAPGRQGGGKHDTFGDYGVLPTTVTAPATDDARTWEGWGSALKPAHEPIVLARKPLVGSIAATVLAHGTGALNIAACRVEGVKPLMRAIDSDARNTPILHTRSATGTGEVTDEGRWPPNVLLGEEAAEELDRQSGESVSRGGTGVRNTALGRMNDDAWQPRTQEFSRPEDAGGASRFFPIFKYEPKADRGERDEALIDLPARTFNRVNPGGLEHDPRWAPTQVRNHHPTVKPVALMRWLVGLVTPPGGVVLDPFAGSGTTGVAAVRDGFRFAGVEREAEYAEIARARIDGDLGPMFRGVAVDAAT